MKKVLVNIIEKPQSWSRRNVLGGAVAVLLLGAIPVMAQNVPIQVAAKQQINDQLGKPLSRVDGDLVQILFVNGHVYPPQGIDGHPHTNNPVAYETRIGYGLINHTSTVGRFNASITRRSEEQIIARVYNAPSVEAASFYADSQVFTPDMGEVFYPVISATTNAFDPADDDGDGLSNSMEKDLGSNPNSLDTDGDGISDMDEFRSGTELADESSYLQMVEILPEVGTIMNVQWSTVPGKSYQLQYTAQELNETNVVYLNIYGVVTATGDVEHAYITNNLIDQVKSFRVNLVD